MQIKGVQKGGPESRCSRKWPEMSNLRGGGEDKVRDGTKAGETSTGSLAVTLGTIPKCVDLPSWIPGFGWESCRRSRGVRQELLPPLFSLPRLDLSEDCPSQAALVPTVGEPTCPALEFLPDFPALAEKQPLGTLFLLSFHL